MEAGTFVIALVMSAIFPMAELSPPPPALLQPHSSLYTRKGPEDRLLVSGGPSNVCPSVHTAIGLQTQTLYEDDTAQAMDEVVEGLRYSFQTRNNWTLPLVGTGSYGLYAVLANLLEPGDTVLVGVNGFWGNRAAEVARNLIGVKVVTLVKEAAEVFSLGELEAALRKYKPNVLFLVHGESSTGVLQDFTGIGDLCHK